MGEAEPTWYCEKCGSHHVISFTHGTQDCATCKRKDKRIAELEEQHVNDVLYYSGLEKKDADSQEEIERLRKAPVRIQINGQQAWIRFDAGEGRTAMVNLNEIVLAMSAGGINRGICMDALAKALAALEGDKNG